jgi:hypothetical protein
MRHGVAVSLVGLLLAGVLAVMALRSHRGQEPVHSVAEVQAHLADDPRAWVGRTVRVHGWAVACLAVSGAPPLLFDNPCPAYLVDSASARASEALPLAWTSQDPVPAFARRFPLLSELLPPPTAPVWGARATNRVRLLPATCGVAPCYMAQLLDAAP